MTTKIHVVVDALGNPAEVCLTEGQAHDLVGAEKLLPKVKAKALIADKAYDADKRVIEPLKRAGKEAVIPPRRSRREARPYDSHLYKKL